MRLLGCGVRLAAGLPDFPGSGFAIAGIFAPGSIGIGVGGSRTPLDWLFRAVF
jgi:hypothetical protein